MHYWIDGQRHDFSSLLDNEIHALLKPFHHASTEHVFCACQRTDAPDTRLPMYIRQNRSTSLSLARVPRSGNEHHRSCRHFDIAAEDAARLGYDDSVLAVDEEGNQVVALSESLRNSAGATEPRASVVRLGPRAVPRRIYARMTPLGLLHLLWERAWLNRHVVGKVPELPDLVRRLRHAARQIRIRGLRSAHWGIEDFLLLQETPALSTARANFAKLKAAADKDKKVLALAVIEDAMHLARLVDARQRPTLRPLLGVTVRGGDVGRTFEDLLAPSFERALSLLHVGARLAVLALAGTRTYEGTPYAIVENVVATAITPAWIPIDSSREFEFTQLLVAQGRQFEKPLRYDAAESVFPDFVLEDTAQPVPIEIYGMGTLADYAARREKKRSIYQDAYPGRHWEWDVQQEGRLQEWLRRHPLPAAIPSRQRQ
ncbi:DUF1173 family protein [Azohydromonas australica]|uniref:DUF1173 family protein n=1 Tax=Azohydromonas australica TaxID=364039 RepID=UPI0003F51520|nr:DUF1173 family protein [Azohydromonas australica]